MIYDTGGLVIYSAAYSVASADSEIQTIQIDCEDGYELRGEPVATLALEARHGTSGPWISIENDSIDLSPWDGSRETFQIRLTAQTVFELTRRVFRLTVKRPDATEVEGVGNTYMYIYNDDADPVSNDDAAQVMTGV